MRLGGEIQKKLYMKERELWGALFSLCSFLGYVKEHFFVFLMVCAVSSEE